MSRNKLHPFYSVQVKNLTDSVIENVNLLKQNQKGVILEPIFSTTTLEQNIFMFKNILSQEGIDFGDIYITVTEDENFFCKKQLNSSILFEKHLLCGSIETTPIPIFINPLQYQESTVITKINLSFDKEGLLNILLSKLYPNVKVQILLFEKISDLDT